jgi:CCR4-NOT transcriptional regulation complex NOT5 subunit
MSTLKSINIIHPSGTTNNIVNDASGNVTVGAALTATAGIVPRVLSAASATSVTINPALYDQYVWTALASTLTFNASTTGSPTNGVKMIFRIKDNGTPQTLTFTTVGTGAYRAVGVTLPITTVANKVTYIGCIYNSTETFWDVVAVQTQA